jgi:fumarate hydratase class II
MDRLSIAPPSESSRAETDSFGSIQVPVNRYWGAQTERSRRNFRIGHDRMPKPIIRVLGIVKLAAAETNRELGLLDQPAPAPRARSSKANSTIIFRWLSGKPARAPKPT